MGLDLPGLHADALTETARLLAAVGDDQWHLPTPCEDWDVRELVNHVVSGNLWVEPLMTGSTIEDVGRRLDGDVLVHGWDLAVGAGLETRLRPDLVEACLEVVLPQADRLAASGAFGEDHEVPEDAPPQAPLLALLGRHG